MRKRISSLAVSFCLFGLSTTCGLAGEVTLLAGHSAELGPVYWIANCVSQLKGAGVVRVSGFDLPAGISLSLRKGVVTTLQCGNQVPGATVMANARKGLAHGSYSFNYLVTYETLDGEHTSSHAATVNVP